ncbi:MAG: hypothetical protein Q9214_001091 [Letrouitia sp. 1 TL-2023]
MYVPQSVGGVWVLVTGLIYVQVQDKNHLLALSNVSKTFRILIFPRLFEVLAIKPYDDMSLWDLEGCPYFAYDKIAGVPKVLTAIKELHFRAPFDLKWRTEWGFGIRCLHSFTPDSCRLSRSSLESEEDDLPISSDDDDAVSKKREEFFDDENGDYGLMRLASKMARILSALPDNQLTGFRWDMGTCFPSAILGEKGYLVMHQHCIRKLSLTTEGNCMSRGPPLKDFINLQELSWKGLLSEDNCASLRTFLELRHERLTSLEVDFINWAEVKDNISDFPDDDDDRDDSTPLIDLILPEREDNYEDFLPNLQTFSLSAASFKGSWDLLINAFNLCGVKELRLLNCERAVELLDYIARRNVQLHATKAELVLGQAEMDNTIYDIVEFLAPFDSLKDLYLLFQSEYTDECYFEMILHYRDTLRRLVYHRRHYCLTETAPYWEEFCDSPLDKTKSSGIAEVLCETKLGSLGVCGELSELQRSFQSIASRADSLKFLHLRFTGKTERKPKFFKESEAYGGYSPSPEFIRAYFEAERNGTTPPRRSPGPSETEFRIRWEQIQGENWREDEEKELEAFADWAFGPNGFPRLQVLVSGDFSYGNRFVDTHRLWCRETRCSTSRRTWRAVERSDIAENELIDANMDMMSACPVSPLFYNYGCGDVFPGIS